MGDYVGDYHKGVLEGDTRSLDYGLYAFRL